MEQRHKGAPPAAAYRPLPRVTSAAQRAVVELLMEQHPANPPPEKSAAVLALLVELHERGMPMPERQVIADYLGCSVYMVDNVLSKRAAQGYIAPEVKVVEGNVQRRESVIRQKFYVPSAELRGAVVGSRNTRVRV